MHADDAATANGMVPRTHVAACPESAKADTLSQPGRKPAPTGLPIGSCYKERDRQRESARPCATSQLGPGRSACWGGAAAAPR
jgi:hypothetical protein